MRTRTATTTIALTTAAVLGLAGCGGGGGSSATTTEAPPAGSGSPSAASSSSSGGGGSGSFPDASLDPCTLLTPAQVAAAVGMKVDPGTPSKSPGEGSRGCDWTTAAYDKGGSALVGNVGIVTLLVVGPVPALAQRYPTASSWFDFQKQVLPHQDPVSGVGDDAFATAQDQELWARQGNVILRILFSGGLGDTSELTPLKQLMTEALGAV